MADRNPWGISKGKAASSSRQLIEKHLSKDKKYKRSDRKVFTTMLNPELRERLSELGQEYDKSLADLIEQAVIFFLDYEEMTTEEEPTKKGKK